MASVQLSLYCARSGKILQLPVVVSLACECGQTGKKGLGSGKLNFFPFSYELVC